MTLDWVAKASAPACAPSPSAPEAAARAREVGRNKALRAWLAGMMELFEAEAAEARERAVRAAAHEVKLRKREADFTPRSVVRAILAWFFEHVLRLYVWPNDPTCEGCRSAVVMGSGTEHTCGSSDYLLVQSAGINRVLSRPTDTIRILDVCAGAGVWASEARRLFAAMGIKVHITAVEIDESERQYLERHADEVVIEDWRTFVERCRKEVRWFDIAIGNPAFSQARAPRVSGEYMPDLAMPAVLAEIAGAVILYLSQQTWTKTRSGFEVRRLHPPAWSVDVPGSVSHRSGINPKTGRRWSADSIPYSASMWLGRIAGPHVGLTSAGMLEPLDGRSWPEDLRPGAEPDSWLRAEGIPYLERST